MTPEIRRLTPEDVAIWRKLRLEALALFPENFLTTHAEEAVRHDDDRRAMLAVRQVYAAFLDGEAVGTAALDPETAAAEAHRASLNAFYARPAHHGSGVGQALLDHVGNAARSQGFVQLELCVASDNTRARRFYERNGFIVWGHLPRSVRLPDRYQDDVFMYCPLDQGGDSARS